ncbi:MAG: hypothetical protein IPL83_07515 [Bdellovibrionales bacterium]|nr:hypothetical protein [Bdellovibrionales bacterium]
MGDKPITEVEEFGHLGLVAALFKDYGLTDKNECCQSGVSDSKPVFFKLESQVIK